MPSAAFAWKPLLLAVLIACTLPACATRGGTAAEPGEPQRLVDDARDVFVGFVDDPVQKNFREALKRTKGVLIVPGFWRAAFLAGASGGTGVLLVKDEASGQWSQPAFYSMLGPSIGVQIGVDRASFVMLALTEKGVETFTSTQLTVGADAGASYGTIGAGIDARASGFHFEADLLSYSRAKGLYMGISMEGNAIRPRHDLNSAYYGRPIDSLESIVRGEVENAGGDALRNAVARAAE